MEPWTLKPAGDFGLPAGQRLRSVRRESGLVEAGSQHVWWLLVRGYLRGIHRLQVSGREHLPTQGPCVIVANHSSHLDALVLSSQLSPRLREHAFPIAAGDTFFKTTMSSALAAATLNALPIWRRNVGHHALNDLRQRLVTDQCVFILFPEGTRSRDGTMGRFKPGIGMLLAGTSVPVVPCHLRGTFDALPADRKVPKPAKLALTIGPPRSFGEVANDRMGWEKIADELKTSIEHLVTEPPA